MQPSSDQPRSTSDSGGSSALRRYGPIVAIVAVLAIIAAVVIAGGGDDDKDSDTSTGTTVADDQRPDGAISWSQAQDEGLDVTFPDTCDTDRGTVAIPISFAPECFADVDDNGGATHQGVTEDSISVVIYSAQDDDAVLDFVTAPIQNDDTSAQSRATVEGFVELFDTYFQTYGRKVDYHFIEASGQSSDEVAASADAARAIEEYKPFAAIGGPVLNNAWSSAMADAGVVCISCGLTGGQRFLEERAPYLYSDVQATRQTNLHVANYVEARLKDGKAEYGGDAVKDEDRVFGHLYIRQSQEADDDADTLYELLDARGIEIADDAKATYNLTDLATLPEQVASAITKLKAAGVTSVLLQGDPYGPSLIMDEATKQGYFPEWVISGGVLLDITAFGRTFDQEQWSHAFGISTVPARTVPEKSVANTMYTWFTGEDPPAIDSAGVLWQGAFLFFNGLQAAGPDLTPENFQAGLFSLEPKELKITSNYSRYGDVPFWSELDITRDYNGPDDKTEIWWDAEATGPDELGREGKGMVRYVEGGKRYLPDDWKGSENHLFEDDGSVLLYEEPPAGEEVPDYPSPAD
ncbi:MAG: ABC transporter substrate-binding protein [Actinobacteria bacterium]|nr:ABC transporter substrate-binding protein [Actinomycetota bacterium]